MSRRSGTKGLATVLPDAEYRFSARLLAAVGVFKATFDIRYYLNGVCFMPHPSGGAIVAATDGHQMGIAYDAEGLAPAERIVAVSPTTLAAAKRYGAGTVAMMAGETRVLVFNAAGQEVHVQAGKAIVEGKFPDVWRVLPRRDQVFEVGMRATVNAMLLARVGAAAKALGLGKFGTAMDCWQADPNGAVYTRLSSETNFLMATMPMCEQDRPSNPMPDRLQLARDAKAKTAPAAPAVPAPGAQPSDASP